MNKTDELLSRLQALEPPVIDNPDELTERIMAQLDDGPMSLHNGSSESVGADSRVCPNSCGLYSENTRNAGKHENLPWSACSLKINRKSLRKSTTVCLNDFESIFE
jgi:hypothetical protein